MNIDPAAVALVAAIAQGYTGVPFHAPETVAPTQGGVPADAPDVPDAPIQGRQSNIVLHGFTIEGIDAAIDAVGREHLNVFYDKVVDKMNESAQSWRLMPREKYECMTLALYQISTGATAKDLKKTYPQVYKWQKAYCVTGDEDSLVLLKRPSNVGDDGTVDVNTLKRMTYLERVYSDIQRNHVVDHSKGRTLHSRISEVFDNISKEVCKIFTDSCPLCVERQARTKPVAGLKPIITSGFGKRGQVDLIDFQSMPDGSFNFLLNYVDHGIKFVFSKPIKFKRASCIAVALLEIFTIIGPPMILQSDNGREFSGAAMTSRQLRLSDQDIDDIISEIKKLWPECRMVRGSPRHSQSNGGVERLNRTVEGKLGAWMKENNCTNWSVGCRIVMWRVNTQQHRTIGDIPYRLMFGQLPRVGISQLPLAQELIDRLATETDLNDAFDVEGFDIGDEGPTTAGTTTAATTTTAAAVAKQSTAGEGPTTAGTTTAGTTTAGGDAADDDDDEAAGEGPTTAGTTTAGTTTAGGDAADDDDDEAAGEGPTTAGTTTAGTAAAMTNDDPANNATKSRTSKTTGTSASDVTPWQQLVFDIGETTIDLDYIRRMPLNKPVPVASIPCGNWEGSDMGAKSRSNKLYDASLLVRTSNSTWELTNEFDDDMVQLEWDGDEGLVNIFGIFIKHPDENFCKYYEDMKVINSQITDEEFSVSPRRAESRKRAAEKMQKSALTMIKTARKSYGNDKPFDVGTVVHVPLKDVDRTKVDSGNLIGIIVKVDKSRSQARVAVQGGLLKSWYVYHKLVIVPGAGNNPSLFGLSLEGWEDLKEITEREAARQVSLVGGQGKGLFTCMCKGKCNSNHCSCFKNKRICGSACHRNNFNCVNHDSHGEDQDMFLPKSAHVDKTNK
jgi:hypothetical protein